MQDTTTPHRVSVVGLGNMGTALAKAFLAHGHRVTVWNRTANKCDALRSAGAHVANSVAQAVEASDAVVVCVLNYTISDSLIRAPEVTERIKRKLVVQLSTGTPHEARAGAAWAQANGADYLDGAIMGYPKDIGTTAGTVLYAGPRAVFERYSGLLNALGGNTVHVGESIGHASTLDSSLLSAYYGSVLGFLHGVAICESEGLPIEGYTAAMLSLLPLLGDTMKTCADMIARRTYEGSQASLSTHCAGVRQSLQLSRMNGVDHAYSQALVSYFERAIAAGHGEHELAALFEVFNKPSAGV
jgi:3-hydroxyisobutyrate dehydrogenase-like beta-hydroxyacid dehydrogenase